MIAALRRLFAAPPPKPPALPGPTVEAVAKLAAELASLRQRVHVAETALAMEMRVRAQLVEAVARHGRDLGWLCATEAHAQGTLATRVAKLELTVMQPVYDGPVSDGRLDEALEAALTHQAEGEA